MKSKHTSKTSKKTLTKVKHASSPKNFWHYLARYFVSVFSVWILITFASVIFPQSQQAICANSISCINNLKNNIENNAIGIFDGQKVVPPKIDLALDALAPKVLGATTPSGPKHIYVDLTHQTLYAFQGNTLIMQTLISSGKWHPTPTGDFKIWIKLRATRMTGGSGADYYDLPNVPYTMFFANNDYPESDGYSLHGAYWHNNFGHPMSHGCVNMRIEDAQALYNWAEPETAGYTTYATANDPGTPVTIYGTAPLD